jgi:hypothetical protein
LLINYSFKFKGLSDLSSIQLLLSIISGIMDKLYVNATLVIGVNDNINSISKVENADVKKIQNRKEYVESIINEIAAGQISQEKLVVELAEEFKNFYDLMENLEISVSQLKHRYQFILDLIMSIPEVQKNSKISEKIRQMFPEDSHP